jgi:hypothetical protein
MATDGSVGRPKGRRLLDLDTLRLLIRSKLDDGRLPKLKLKRVFGGPGKDEICTACATRITKDQFVSEGICLPDAGPVLTLQVQCFWLWETERRRWV